MFLQWIALFTSGLLTVASFYVNPTPREQIPWLGEKEEKVETPVCRSQACFKAAYNIWESMNTSVNPCDDFYDFACGKWIKNNPVPVTESHWNKFDVLAEEMDRHVHTLLQEPILPDDMQAVQKVKSVYRACMNEERLEKKGLSPLVGLLDHLEGWPMAGWNSTSTDWFLLIATSTKLLDVAPLLEVGVSVDKKDTSRRIITIDQPSLTIPRYELTEGVSGVVKAYIKYAAATASMVSKVYGHQVPDEAVNMEAESMVQFETRLAQITKKQESRRDKKKMYHIVTVGRLQELTDSVPVINRDMRIQWLPFLSRLLSGTSSERNLDQNTEIVVKDLHFMYHLLMLIDATPYRVLVNYIQWRVVRTMSRDLNKSMRDLSFSFEQEASQIGEDQPRWRECVGNSGYLFFAVGYMYVVNHFSLFGKEKAVKMVSEIREAFRKELAEITWMDDDTKKAALEKADFMNYFIGYPHWYINQSSLNNFYTGLNLDNDHFENIIRLRKFLVHKNLDKLGKPTDREEWLFGPAIVNAFYNPELNSIIFPAGILQQPFFNDHQLDALNYGGIGVIIGHEVSHGFDDTGRQGDKSGNIHQWWSESTETTYLEKAQCFIDQYQGYRVPELDTLLHRLVTVNGLLTLGENIADNGGLRAAYRAYRTQVMRRGKQEERLPGLEHLSPDQLFFLSFANVWCESTTKRSLLAEVLDDSHAPHRHRVLGTLTNSPDFAKAWNCQKGSPMNPVDKCQLW